MATPSTAKAQVMRGKANSNLSGATLALTVTGSDAHEGRAITVNITVESGTVGSRIRVPTKDFISSPTSGHIIDTSPEFMTLNTGNTSTSFTVTVRDDNVYRQKAMLRVDLPRAWAGGWLYERSATQYYATLMIVDNDLPDPPPLQFSTCDRKPLNGAPRLDLYKGAPNGGEICYRVRLASQPTHPHEFYATARRWEHDKPAIGISGKDVYLYDGPRFYKRWSYEWSWNNRGRFLTNNYGQTHYFTADNWDEWVTIGVRCCRHNYTNPSGTWVIKHYLHKNPKDNEGREGPNARITLRAGARSQDSPSQAPPPPSQPTDPVSNVQVTAADDSSATVTWDAVAHASSYLIDYEGTASDPQDSIAGSVSGHTGTSWTLQHNAAESMTITVTVTPEYLDGDGLIQQADDLAGTATLDVGPGSGADTQSADPQATDSQPGQACVSDALLGDVEGYAAETWRSSSDHVERWSRVLAAFGVSNSYSTNAMTATEAQTLADRGLPRWVPVATALECLETTPEEQPEAQPAQAETPTPAPPATPEMSISAGNDVTEGADATFTVTASPAPASDLDVTVTISQSGDFAATGSRTVTISTTGSATFTVTTTDDSTDEPDGSVTATLGTGAGYSLSSSSSTATVAVSDNDDAPPPPPPPPATSCVSGTMLNQVRHYYDVNKDRAPGYGKNWKRVLIAFGDTTDTTLTAFTAAEARDRESNWSGWRPVRVTLECIESAN